jgi:hypothetical protein
MSIEYLPDFNFSGLSLDFKYTVGLQPIDSPKYNWIDWATLDCILADGATSQPRLFDRAIPMGSDFQSRFCNRQCRHRGSPNPAVLDISRAINVCADCTVAPRQRVNTTRQEGSGPW